MSWWDPRTWMRNLFPAANEPGGFMVREGKQLQWERSRLPIAVYVDRAADPWWGYVDEAVRWINLLCGFPAPTTIEPLSWDPDGTGSVRISYPPTCVGTYDVRVEPAQ